MTPDAGSAGAEGKISEANTMPYILEAVRAYATVGEICEALREVYGTYEEASIYVKFQGFKVSKFNGLQRRYAGTEVFTGHEQSFAILQRCTIV